MQFVRLAETDRTAISLTVDGRRIEALEGDTLLTALLVNGTRVRESEFGDGPRAGHCLMAACQDCWVWMADNTRVRACSTYATDGMDVKTQNPVWPWTHA